MNMPTNELKNNLDLQKILEHATMIRIETQYATEIPGKNWNIVRARSKDGEYKEFKFEDLEVETVALKLYHNKTVTDMWAVGYGNSRTNNIGLTIEDGVLSCGMKKDGGQLTISCRMEE